MLAERKQFDTAEVIESPRTEAKVCPQMRLVKQADQQRAVKATLLGLGVVIFVLCFAYVALQASIYNEGYAINKVKAQIDEVKNQSARVSLEVDFLSSMERIEPLAFALGMTYPEVTDKVLISYTPVSVPLPLQAENAELPMQQADVHIEVFSPPDVQQLSYGDRLLQVLGSLFGSTFGIGD